jgi:hypothetical protein
MAARPHGAGRQVRLRAGGQRFLISILQSAFTVSGFLAAVISLEASLTSALPVLSARGEDAGCQIPGTLAQRRELPGVVLAGVAPEFGIDIGDLLRAPASGKSRQKADVLFQSPVHKIHPLVPESGQIFKDPAVRTDLVGSGKSPQPDWPGGHPK